MSNVHEVPIPSSSFMNAYSQAPDHHADAFLGQIDQDISLEKFIIAFFDSSIFKIERWIISILLFKKIKRRDVEELASGTSNQLALWIAKKRNETELLMEVSDSQIRTWLHTQKTSTGATKLYFGSAIVPKTDASGATLPMGLSFRLLMGFHKAYSKILLQSAMNKLKRNNF